MTAPVFGPWTGHRVGVPFNRNMRWTHPAIAGLTIKHCGHPTALRPYFVQLAADCALTSEDFGDHQGPWRRLADAQEAVETVFAATRSNP